MQLDSSLISESGESVRFTEKSDLSTEIASETDQEKCDPASCPEADPSAVPPVEARPFCNQKACVAACPAERPDTNDDKICDQDLSQILKRPHRTICGKFDEFKYD